MKSTAIKKARRSPPCTKRTAKNARLFIEAANDVLFVPAFLPAAIKGVCGIFYA